MIVERASEGKAVVSELEGFCEGRPAKAVVNSTKFLQKRKKRLSIVNECRKALGIGRSKWYAKAKELSILGD